MQHNNSILQILQLCIKIYHHKDLQVIKLMTLISDQTIQYFG